MTETKQGYEDLGKNHSIPLEHITPPVSLTGMWEISEELFPTLWRRIQSKGGPGVEFFPHYYTTHFKSETIQFETLLDHFDDPGISLIDLLRRQRQVRQPGKEVFGADNVDQALKGNHETQMEYRHFLSTKSFLRKAYAERPLLEPDESATELTGDREPHVSTFTALKLLTQYRNQVPEESLLYKVIQVEQIPFNSYYLRQGFIDLMTTNTIQTLKQRGILKDTDFPQLYLDAAHWMAELALTEYYEEPKKYQFPYSGSNVVRGELPPTEFLPYILMSTSMFLDGLPHVITPGNSFSIYTIESNMNELQRTLQTVIDLKTQRAVMVDDHHQFKIIHSPSANAKNIIEIDPADGEKIQGIEASMSYMSSILLEQYQFLQKNQKLIGKKGKISGQFEALPRIQLLLKNIFPDAEVNSELLARRFRS